MDLCKHLRMAFDGIEGRIDGVEKPFAQPFDLRFVVSEGLSKIPTDPATKDERKRH